MKRPVKLTLAALILVCAGSVAWLLLAPGRTDHPVAAITLDGEVLDEIDLTQVQEPYSFPVTGKDGLTNTVLVHPGGEGRLSRPDLRPPGLYLRRQPAHRLPAQPAHHSDSGGRGRP